MLDSVFGELTYKNGWEKIDVCNFWNTDQLKIVVSAYQNEKPNENQKDAYSRFKSECKHISRKSYIKMKEYMEVIKEDILPYCGMETLPEDICELVSINHILFLESGVFAIICDSKWDNHGVTVLCTKTEMIAGPQDIIWLQE